MTVRTPRRRGDRGATIVEFAFVFPILALLMFGMADIGLVVVGRSVGSAAARDGARVGIINFDCADQYASGGTAAHDDAKCTAGTTSANYTAVRSAVIARLAGLVKGTPAVDVRCYTADATTTEPCSKSTITPGSGDRIEVKVTWQHVSATPFVVNTTHTDSARMVITGPPDVSGGAPAGNSYTCVAPDTSDPLNLSVIVKGATTDTSVTTGTFTLTPSTGAVYTAGPTAKAGDGTVAATIPYASLIPNMAYTYTVAFSPGGHTASDPTCAFTTPAATPNFLVQLVNPANERAGAPFQVKITARIGSATDTSYVGSHSLSWTGPGTSPNGTAPSFPANPVSFSNGVATVSMALFKAETASLNVTDGTRNGSLTALVVNPALGLTLSGCAGGTVNLTGSSWTTAVATAAADSYGNPAPGGYSVTLTLSNTQHFGVTPSTLTIPTGGTTSGTATVTANGNNKTTVLTATSPDLTSASCTVNS